MPHATTEKIKTPRRISENIKRLPKLSFTREKQSFFAPLKAILKRKFGSFYNVVLITFVKLDEISAPTPHSDDKALVCLGILFCFKKRVSVYRVQLKLMTAEVDEGFDQSRDFFVSVCRKARLMKLERQRTAVDSFCEVVPRKGAYRCGRGCDFRVK